jgi:Ca2+-binding EF-hand superfamily protein
MAAVDVKNTHGFTPEQLAS